MRDYEEPVLSFDHNIFNLGIHSPGRFVGFDTMEVVSATSMKVKHTGTGFTYKDTQNTSKGPCGVMMSQQGVLIMEDDFIGPFTIDSNSGNSSRRYDIIVMTHTHVLVTGGQAATYSVIKGTVGSEIKPIPSDPLTQTIVGTVELQANGDLTTAKWFKAKNPDSGDGEDARLNEANVFKAIQIFKQSEGVYNTPSATDTTGGSSSNLWSFEGDGNSFKMEPSAATTVEGIRVKDVPIQEGARIVIFINDKVTLTQKANWANSSNVNYRLGYRSIRANLGMTNTDVAYGTGTVRGIKPTSGQVWSVELILYKDEWWVLGMNGVEVGASFSPGDIVMWYGDVSSNFDATGKGINLKKGFAICNGLNGAPDMRGKIIAMATDVPVSGGQSMVDEAALTAAGLIPAEYILGTKYTKTGSKEKVITIANLPSYALPVTDPGHAHTTALGTDLKGGSSGEYVLSTQNIKGSVTRPTNTVTTGIVVQSGGSDIPLSITPPVYMAVLIMKL
jgi:hypothetical protein